MSTFMFNHCLTLSNRHACTLAHEKQTAEYTHTHVRKHLYTPTHTDKHTNMRGGRDMSTGKLSSKPITLKGALFKHNTNTTLPYSNIRNNSGGVG